MPTNYTNQNGRFQLRVGKSVPGRFILRVGRGATSRLRVRAQVWLNTQARYRLTSQRTYLMTGGRFIVDVAPTAPEIVVPVGGGLYTTLTLSATTVETTGETWYAKFEYATSADAFASWTLIGNGAQVAAGSPSTLTWPLGPLDVTRTYKVRATAYDQFGLSSGTTTMGGVFQVDHVLAPTVTAPADAAILDSLATQTFTWTFNDPDAGHAQIEYALRRTRQSDGQQRWWRASDSSWQSSEVYNASGAGSAAFTAGLWDRGVYTWAVATRDTMGGASAYTTDRSVTLTPLITPSITAPPSAGNLTTQAGTAVWTVNEQIKYRLRLLTGGGFTTVLSDTGVVASTSARSAAWSGAANGTTVRFELTTWSVDNLPSTVTRDKSVVYTGPTAPTAIASVIGSPPRVRLVVTNPGGGDTFASNSILRSDDGGVTYNVIASGLGAGVTYDDHTVGAGKTYSYKVRAYGAASTFTDSAVI